MKRRTEPEFQNQVAGKSLISIGSRVYDLAMQEYVESISTEVATSPENIDHLFAEGGRKIGEGLHVDFWKRLTASTQAVSEIRRAKIEVAVLLRDPEILAAVEDTAEKLVDEWRKGYADAIEDLPEKRLAAYDEIASTADKPTEITLRHPVRVMWRRREDAPTWERHIYVDDSDQFADEFNRLEEEVLKKEIPRSNGWLRNSDRKSWSLTLPYERRPGEYRPVYPDFLFFRDDNRNVEVDILDPHGAHLPEAVMKAQGLAVYTEEHGHRFGRVETIDRIDGQLRRLDMKNKKIRDQVKALVTNDGLVALYKAAGQV